MCRLRAIDHHELGPRFSIASRFRGSNPKTGRFAILREYSLHPCKYWRKRRTTASAPRDVARGFYEQKPTIFVRSPHDCVSQGTALSGHPPKRSFTQPTNSSGLSWRHSQIPARNTPTLGTSCSTTSRAVDLRFESVVRAMPIASHLVKMINTAHRFKPGSSQTPQQMLDLGRNVGPNLLPSLTVDASLLNCEIRTGSPITLDEHRVSHSFTQKVDRAIPISADSLITSVRSQQQYHGVADPSVDFSIQRPSVDSE